MKKLPRSWRPMKDAPKDGTPVLLAYESFAATIDRPTSWVVAIGAWVTCPSRGCVEKFDEYMLRPGDSRLRLPSPLPPSDHQGHWVISYVSIRQHGGASPSISMCRGWKSMLTHEAREVNITPLAWRPVPKFQLR